MKRKSIKKQIKSKLYVAKATEGGWSRSAKPAVRQSVVDEVQAILTKPQFKKLQKHIERISITKTTKRSGRVTTGRIVHSKNKKPVYKIFDHDGFPPEYYRSVAVHELAHVSWAVMQKWHNGAWTAFNAKVEILRPVNNYLERNESKWRADKRFESNQYCNEMHSAAAELYYEASTSGHIWQYPEDQKRLLAAYRELHGL